MRKIINSTYLSLDGVVERPHEWPTSARPSDERAAQIQTDLLLACDAVLMGRRTYDGFAPVWQPAPAIRTPSASTRCPSTWSPRR
jgi:dihydrofolate reductase